MIVVLTSMYKPSWRQSHDGCTYICIEAVVTVIVW